MHSAPLKGGDSLLGWCAQRYPETLLPQGRLSREGGLLHRLDYGAWGLVLIARTQEALEALRLQQGQGRFVKEYGVLTEARPRPLLPGFPLAPSTGPAEAPPFAVESAFRAYGPGRRAVRPVPFDKAAPHKRPPPALDQGKPYRTEILDRRETGNALYFRARLTRGFRHQIRCHLSWLGHPVLGDGLYGQAEAEGPLMLKAQGLFFPDPITGESREYRLPSIAEDSPLHKFPKQSRQKIATDSVIARI
jgi:23S rRNA pseudouridine1911/1915/1917 synthase